MILALRTDKPEAELYAYNDGQLINELHWHAHRELSDTLLNQVETLLETSKAMLCDVTALIIYSGPGSFTGLRIGITVANSLAYALGIPIVGVSGEAWLPDGLKLVAKATAGHFVVPRYGAAPHITQPRK